MSAKSKFQESNVRTDYEQNQGDIENNELKEAGWSNVDWLTGSTIKFKQLSNFM